MDEENGILTSCRAQGLAMMFFNRYEGGAVVELGTSRPGGDSSLVMGSTRVLAQLCRNEDVPLYSIDNASSAIAHALAIRDEVGLELGETLCMDAAEGLGKIQEEIGFILLDCVSADGTLGLFKAALSKAADTFTVVVDDVSVPGHPLNEDRLLGKAAKVAEWMLENRWSFTVESYDDGFSMLVSTREKRS